jgi:hypothetical protein
MDNDEYKPIEPPQQFPGRKITRDVAEALAGEIPVAGPVVTAVLRNTHPPIEEKDRERWEQDVTKRANRISDTVAAHEEILRPLPDKIEGVAAVLAGFLARLPHDGLCRGYMLNEMAPDLPRAPPFQVVVDAAEELAMYDLVEVQHFIGGQQASVRLCPAFFEQLDPQIVGWSPAADARHLATMLLENDSLSAIAELHAASGWEKRRFNPAMQYLLQFFEPGHISRELQPDYPTNQVMLFGPSRARLRRFASASS